MNYFSWISLLMCVSFMCPPPNMYSQPERPSKVENQEQSPSTMHTFLNKTKSILGLILTYLGLKAHAEQEQQIKIKKSKPELSPIQIAPDQKKKPPNH